MMQQLRNPKNVKMISLFVAAIFVLSCFAVTLQQGAFTSIASAAASESAIGVVNYQMLLAQSPDDCRCAGCHRSRKLLPSRKILMKKQGYERYRKAALLPAAAGSNRQQGKRADGTCVPEN